MFMNWKFGFEDLEIYFSVDKFFPSWAEEVFKFKLAEWTAEKRLRKICDNASELTDLLKLSI